ncbi:MAG: hydroxymethylbilane synthase [Saprospiraceae bacterium]|nr:hydroxymethylbilane synthase [Saprospiraceae bacterium]
MKIICRKSNLSKAQGQLARQILMQHFPDVSIDFLYKKTSGDLDQTTPLYQMVDKNVFSSDIDAALLKGSADFAVHSLKDVGAERLLNEGAFVSAVFERDLPHDIVVFKANILEKIKKNRPPEEKSGQAIRIGTSSLRREELTPSFLQKALPIFDNSTKEKPIIEIKPIRGNVETRLRKLVHGADYDGIVLAAAALNRLLKSAFFKEVTSLLKGTLKMWLPLVECPPALGQGALLIECLKTNERGVEMLKTIDNQQLKTQLLAERAATLDFGKGCHQRYGAVFIENKEGGNCVISAGKTADGHSANRFVFDVDERLIGKKIVSATDFMRDFFDYKFYEKDQIIRDFCSLRSQKEERWFIFRALPEKQTTFPFLLRAKRVNSSFFIAHHRAVTDEIVPILSGNKNWVSGTKTWFELAKKGIWVEGCADGFGIDFLENVWQSPLANISEKELIVLTNEDSAHDWQHEGRKAIATYRLIPNSSAGLIVALQSAEVIFWTSFKQFEACKQFTTEGVIHACPAGKTARKLVELGLKPAIFPSIKAFLNVQMQLSA